MSNPFYLSERITKFHVFEKREKTRKSDLVPMSRQEKLADLFLPHLNMHDQKLSIGIPSLNFPEMKPFGTFSQFYQFYMG